MQAVGAGRQRRPVLPERGGELGEFRPGPLGDGEIGGGERVFLDGNEMQPAAALRVGAPGLPGGEEIQPEAEAGFENDEALPALPARRQIVAAEKDVPRLRRPAGGGVVDIAVSGGKRGAIRIEFEAGGLQRHGGDFNPAGRRSRLGVSHHGNCRFHIRAAGS